MIKKTYIKGKFTTRKLKTVKLRKPSVDSYNEISGLLIATYPGCGHSCTSDRRLKTNIKKLQPVLKNISRITPVSFDWKLGEAKKGNIGLIAQDLEQIYPELVHEGPDGYKRIEYDKLTAILISAVQELTQRIEILEKKK
ncbi:MAG: tail fiber domain-containing protein [Candidatus Roizmanbacteria bacterium]|nr:tail fiber domain-containing protein [Candidatus Roizmanbacteria bacterium]